MFLKSESLFNKVTGLKTCNCTKKQTPTQVISCEYCEIFKDTYLEEHLQTTAFAVNPLMANALFPYLLNTSEKLCLSDIFMVYRERNFILKWIMLLVPLRPKLSWCPYRMTKFFQKSQNIFFITRINCASCSSMLLTKINFRQTQAI